MYTGTPDLQKKFPDMKKIDIQIGKNKFTAEIFQTATGLAIVDALPLASKANTWGDEIYFHVPVHANLEPGAQSEVSVGDLAYWPTMPAFCIFFGPTPASNADEPRAISAVNVFGKLLDINLEELRSIEDGEKIEISPR